MATINRDFFITQFEEEVNDHVHRVAQQLFQLEEDSTDQTPIVEEIFRIAHTLKGSARMMGFADISTLAHRMEDLLVEVRDEHLDLTATVIDLLFYSLDTINSLIEGISKPVKRTANIEEISALFNDVIAGKQIEVPHLESRMLESAHQEALPVRQASEAEPVVEQLTETENHQTENHQYVRIHTGDLDTILNLVGEVLITQHRYEGQRTAFQEIIDDLREHRATVSELRNRLQKQNGVGVHRLSQLADDLERSTSGMLRKAKGLIKRTRNDGQQMHLAMNKLQAQVIGIRMVPASRIFHPFPRLARMTARKLGKMVELEMSGEDTKIDSRIIEEMRAPLIHLVQNAIRHGIESPENRKSYGKKPGGTVTISATQEGNRIVIRVKDDGRGIDSEQVKEQALKHGLISHRDLKTIKDQDLLEVLFRSGVSTAEDVDDIAGRGFGLNIVRTHVDRVQGEIEVHSQPAKGTEFVIKLPLTLAITNVLLVQVNDQVFAIPVIAIEKTFDIVPNQIEYLGKMPVVIVDGQFLPIVELQQILGIHPSPSPNPQQRRGIGSPRAYSPPLLGGVRGGENGQLPHKTVIVIHAEERRIGFLVDDLIEEREIVIKHLGPCLKRVRNVAGATTVRSEVVIILYVRDLVRSADVYLKGYAIRTPISLHDGEIESETTEFRRLIPRILVVDDSLNSREVECAILEDAGYDVELAENGARAYQKLQQMGYDLVLTDIEMPEMSGFQLIKRLREDENFRNIPIIVVSAAGAAEAKTRALQAGAQAYIVKGEFDEHVLVAAIDSCLKERKA